MVLSREVKRPVSIILCEEISCNLINVLVLFSVILQPRNFHNVKFANTSSAGKTTKRKSHKYFSLSALNWNLNHSNL